MWGVGRYEGDNGSARLQHEGGKALKQLASVCQFTRPAMVAYSTSLDVSQSAQSPERGQLARRVAESTRRFPILSCIGRATSPERVVVETAAAAVSSQRSDSITGEEYCLLRPRIAGEATPCKDASENVLYPQKLSD